MRRNDEGGSADLLAFPIDVDAVLQHLNRDMRDDWFEDALQHRDLFSSNSKPSLREVLSEVLLEGNGRYVPIQSYVCDIPKKGLGIRYALETDFYDRFIYQSICSFLIPYYDPLLSHRVLGHRYDPRKRVEKSLFKGRIELWQTFEGVTKTALRSGRALFATDLINYFENISVESIRSSFDDLLPSVRASGPEKVLIRNAINTLCDLMVRWCFNERHGLPQNRDASSFIANVVLNSVDRSMVESGFDYYRYVDDIRIICDSQRSARRAAAILIGKLRSVGMNINSSKTKILTGESPQADIDEFFPSSDDRSVAIDNMWKSKSRRVIMRSARYVFQMLSECIESRQTQSRQFRFAVNRLIRLVDAGMYDVQEAMSSKLKSLLIDSLEEHAASTDQYCRLLISLVPNEDELGRVEGYLCDNELAIHSWQNFHLWMVFARLGYKSQTLIDLGAQRIREDILRSEVPAIFIYLRCVGDGSTLKSLIGQFKKSWPYYHQRNYLLSISDLDRELVKPLVPEIGPKLRGTMDRAKSHFVNSIPLVERERTPISRMYEELNPYD